jgi:hypothetical protein
MTGANRAIETLMHIIAKADVALAVRQKWLERLWETIKEDAMLYLESIGDSRGELYATP